MQLGDLERLVARHRRQDRGEPAREHRLARAGWTDHEDVVAACRRDLEGPAGLRLTRGPRARSTGVPRVLPTTGRLRERPAATSLAGTRPPPRARPRRRPRDRRPGRPRRRSRRDDDAPQVPRVRRRSRPTARPGWGPGRPGATARRRTPTRRARPPGTCAVAASTPMRDREVRPGPSLRRVPGERFTTTRRSSHSSPALSTAGLIRSRASWTPAPGSPVIVSDGSPRPTCASTATR